jgi:uncharacterized protein with GYD domain
MPKYLLKVSYTSQGAKGVLKEGGTSRRGVVEKLTQNMGGTLEGFYFALGEDDVYVIADFPSNSDVAAVSMTVAAAGAANVTTVALLSPEEIDQAAQKTVEYSPPGG